MRQGVVILCLRVSGLVLLACLVAGCASFRQTCRYEAGELVKQVTRSTVVGTGDTEVVSSACAEVAYSTHDTGFSENAAPVIEAVGEGVAKGLVKGATGGFPVP